MQTFRNQVLTDGVGFDNLAAAMVSVIQVLTYAGWSYMMYRTTDTYGLYAIIYFVLCIIVGCYFVVRTSYGVHAIMYYVLSLIIGCYVVVRTVVASRSDWKHSVLRHVHCNSFLQ